MRWVLALYAFLFSAVASLTVYAMESYTNSLGWPEPEPEPHSLHHHTVVGARAFPLWHAHPVALYRHPLPFSQAHPNGHLDDPFFPHG